MRQTAVEALPDYGPVPQSALGPALNEQGYYVGRVERNLYWVTDGTYLSAFLTTSDGVVLLDAPPTIGHNLQRAVDEIAAANGVSNKECRNSGLSLTRRLVSGHRLVQAIAVPPGCRSSSRSTPRTSICARTPNNADRSSSKPVRTVSPPFSSDRDA